MVSYFEDKMDRAGKRTRSVTREEEMKTKRQKKDKEMDSTDNAFEVSIFRMFPISVYKEYLSIH